ncbi:hypothetical protein ACM42_36295 [Bradyrhizobium sp. CCBAU 25338]|nr:hypothetical protein [Bradyrhizobium sp. CCBAU 25338]
MVVTAAMELKTDCELMWKPFEIDHLTDRAKHWRNGIIQRTRIKPRTPPRALLLGGLSWHVSLQAMLDEAQS